MEPAIHTSGLSGLASKVLDLRQTATNLQLPGSFTAAKTSAGGGDVRPCSQAHSNGGVRLNGQVLGFAIALSAVTAFACGLLPALQCWQHAISQRGERCQ